MRAAPRVLRRMDSDRVEMIWLCLRTASGRKLPLDADLLDCLAELHGNSSLPWATIADRLIGHATAYFGRGEAWFDASTQEDELARAARWRRYWSRKRHQPLIMATG